MHIIVPGISQVQCDNLLSHQNISETLILCIKFIVNVLYSISNSHFSDELIYNSVWMKLNKFHKGPSSCVSFETTHKWSTTLSTFVIIIYMGMKTMSAFQKEAFNMQELIFQNFSLSKFKL